MSACVVGEGGGGEGIETMSETIPQQQGRAPHRKEDPETMTGLISMQACVQRQLSVEGD
jgi:hypothetical protein